MLYKKENPNELTSKAGDCVVRAIALATEKGWLDVFDGLTDTARAVQMMPNSKAVYEAYLERRGFKKHPMPKHPNGTRYTVRDLADEYPNTTMVVQVANHLTCVTDGCVRDLWDCSSKSVYNYYTK